MFTVSGLHPGFWIGGGRIGELKNVGGAKLSEIICLLMNLTDPRGGGGVEIVPPLKAAL